MSADIEASLERPIDRLFRAGVAALSDAELVSLLLDRTISASASLVCDGLPAFARKPWGSAAAPATRRQSARVLASFELHRRLSASSEKTAPITSAAAVAYPLLATYAHRIQEVLGAISLDAKHRILREREIFIGTINSALVSTRDVLRFALDDHAASIIVFHNHPSGDPAPSADDLAFTRKLVEAGKALGIEVLDHLILGRGSFVSLKDRGLL